MWLYTIRTKFPRLSLVEVVYPVGSNLVRTTHSLVGPAPPSYGIRLATDINQDLQLVRVVRVVAVPTKTGMKLRKCVTSHLWKIAQMLVFS